MNSFSQLMTHAIHEYKKILKKKVPQNQYSQALQELGIKRLQLRNLNDAALLKVANNILQNIDQIYGEMKKENILYSGIQEFKSHLNSLVNNYCVHGNHVINPSQKASAIILEAIQLLALPNSKITAVIVKKLENCTESLIQYGTAHQLSMMVNALKKQGAEKMDFCIMLIHRIEKYLKESRLDMTLQEETETD